jgi:hypothetical protein
MAGATNNLIREDKGVFAVMPGAELDATIAEAIERSKREDRPITFNFSGVPLTVEAESDPTSIRVDMFCAWEQLHSGS